MTSSSAATASGNTSRSRSRTVLTDALAASNGPPQGLGEPRPRPSRPTDRNVSLKAPCVNPASRIADHRPRQLKLVTCGIVVGLLLALAPAASAHTLTYRDAREAAQKKADQFAGQRTSIKSLSRSSRHRYSARGEWEEVDPTGCKGCGYDPDTDTFYDTPTTSYCSVTLIVRYRTAHARRPVAIVDEHSCF